MTELTDKQLQKDFKAVHVALKEAAKYSLEVEVVVYSLFAMQARPDLTVEEAVALGFNEWVK